MKNIGSMHLKIFEILKKMRISIKIFIFYENLEFHRNYGKFREKMRIKKGHSTSAPCGNLVDGLPHACHTETIAELARLGPAENGTTLTESDRIDKVLLDNLQENPQKTLSSVY